jgi:mRNA-degrading endonuclease HigB of HigAB toxin-antitoxin module
MDAVAVAHDKLAELLYLLYNTHAEVKWDRLPEDIKQQWEIDADAVRGYLFNVEGKNV